MDSVLSLINDKGLRYRSSAQDYLISCLNPEHTDKNPSMRVDKTTGVFHCFSCGFRGNIFKHFGVFANTSSIKIQKLKSKLREIKYDATGLEFPPGTKPVTTSFKGVSRQTLLEFSAFTTIQEETLIDRIVIPIKDIKGRIVLFHGRHTSQNAKPKYINFPSSAKLPLFPSKLSEPNTSVVLVEGIFDMLNLYDKGLKNVCCIFGTSTFKNEAEQKMLALKAQGVTRVYLLLDSDEAGRKASKELKSLLEELNYYVEEINLPEDVKDPGELDQDSVLCIKEYIDEEATKR